LIFLVGHPEMSVSPVTRPRRRTVGVFLFGLVSERIGDLAFSKLVGDGKRV
jgi:hypothetical protein